MLKKEDMIPGTIVKVNNKKSEWDEVNNGLFCWLFDQGGPSASSMLQSGTDKSVLPDSVIKIIAAPRSYRGSCLLVKFKIVGQQDELATWWALMKTKVDFISRPDGLTPDKVPVLPKKAKGTFTERQLNRLPEQGYLLEYFDTANDNPMFKNPTAICVMNGKCKYISYVGGTEWNTLLWSCCPTKNQIEKSKKNSVTRSGYRYEWFATHAEMSAAHPELSPIYHTKAPNDL